MISSRQINNISGNLFIFTLLLFSLLLSSTGNTLRGQNRSASSLSTIIIDAGHGGKDPGAVVGRACEKDIVLDIARRLGRKVRQGLPDVKIVYTRTDDYFVPLFKRSALANKINANLFISIHANYCESSSVKGTETYVLGLHRTQENLEVEKKENSVVLFEDDYSKRYEGFDPNSPVSNIMFELIQDNHIKQSLLFAGMVQDRFRQHAGRSDRNVRQAGFLVLRETAMPSVLIETGYLSNKAEAAYLMTESGRETIASSIYNSIKNYKQKFDSRLVVASAAIKDTQRIKEENKESSNVENLAEKVTEQPTEKKDPVIKNTSVKLEKEVRKEVSGAKTSPEQSYAIQITASKVKLSKSFHLFRGIQNIREVQIAGYYKYYCFESDSRKKTFENLRSVRSRIPDAFVVSMKNGIPVAILKTPLAK